MFKCFHLLFAKILEIVHSLTPYSLAKSLGLAFFLKRIYERVEDDDSATT